MASDQLQRHRGYGSLYQAVPMLVALCLLCATSTPALTLPLLETSPEINVPSGNLPACGVVLVSGRPVLPLICVQNDSIPPSTYTYRVTTSLLQNGPNLTVSCEVRRPGNTLVSVELKKRNKTTRALDSLCTPRVVAVRSAGTVIRTTPHDIRPRNIRWQDEYFCAGHERNAITGQGMETVLGSVNFRYDFHEASPASLPTQATATDRFDTTAPSSITMQPEASSTPSTKNSMSQAGTVLQTTTPSRPAESTPPHHTVASSRGTGSWPPMSTKLPRLLRYGTVAKPSESLVDIMEAATSDGPNLEDVTSKPNTTFHLAVIIVSAVIVLLALSALALLQLKKAKWQYNRRNRRAYHGAVEEKFSDLGMYSVGAVEVKSCHLEMYSVRTVPEEFTSERAPREVLETDLDTCVSRLVTVSYTQQPGVPPPHPSATGEEDPAPTLGKRKSVVGTASADVKAATTMFDPLGQVPPSHRLGSFPWPGQSATHTGPHRATTLSENNQPTVHQPEVEPAAQLSFTPGVANPVESADFEVDSLLDCSSLDGMGEDDNALSDSVLPLAQAVIREEGHLLRKSSHMLIDAIRMSWLTRPGVYRFRYSNNTLRPASSSDRSAARCSEDLLALTMATNDDIRPFTPRLLAPVVNIKCLMQTVPRLRLSHVLNYPVTDGDLADYNLAVLKLNSTLTAWKTHQVLSVADLSADRIECTGTISQTGSFTVALLPKKYNPLICVIPTIECGHDRPETPTEGASGSTSSQPISDTTAHDHPSNRRGSGDGDDGNRLRRGGGGGGGGGGGDDGGGGDLTGFPDNYSLPRDAILTAYTKKTREYPNEVTVYLKVFYCPGHPDDNQLLQRVKRGLELQDFIFVLEGRWFLGLGKVKETDEVQVKFRMRDSPGVTVEPEDKLFGVAPSAVGDNDLSSVDFRLDTEADPSAYIRCGMPVKVLPSERSAMGYPVLRFKLPPMMSAERESVSSQVSDGNASMVSVAFGSRTLPCRPPSSSSSSSSSSSASVYARSESSRASRRGNRSVSQSSAEELTSMQVISPGHALQPSVTPHTRAAAAAAAAGGEAAAGAALVSAHGETGSVTTLDSIMEGDVLRLALPEIGHHLQTHRPGRHANNFNVQGIHGEPEREAAEEGRGRMARALRPLPQPSRAVSGPPSLHSVSVNSAQTLVACGSVQSAASLSEGTSVHSLAAASQHGPLASQQSDTSGYDSPPEPGLVREAAEPESEAPRGRRNEDEQREN